MERTTVITSGAPFIDIDAYACIFAYQELLQKQGKKVLSLVTSHPNASIIHRYKKDFYSRDTKMLWNIPEKGYVLVDVSDPKHFESFVEEKEVTNVFDHHPGFENFWKEKIGKNAVIEPVGAAATLIFREYKKSQFLQEISPFAAELLAAAILSNTLSFQAQISTQEDKDAYAELSAYFNFQEQFESEYFLEVQRTIENTITESLVNDSKRIDFLGQKIFIAQLEVFDAENILRSKTEDISNFLQNSPDNITFLNLIEIGKGRNVIIFKNRDSKDFLLDHLSI